MRTETTQTAQARGGRAEAEAERAMLTGEGTYATTLLVWAVDRFGVDPDDGVPYVCKWAPETVRMEVEQEAGLKLPGRNFSRLMAAVAVASTDLFFTDAARFVQLANVLAGADFDPGVFDPADAVECAWAVTEALLLRPPDEDPEPFGDEVRAYLGQVLREEGYVTAPDVLGIALGADQSALVADGFADDPEMYQALQENQAAKTAAVEDTVATGLAELLAQLQALRLRTGSVDQVAHRIGQALARHARGRRT